LAEDELQSAGHACCLFLPCLQQSPVQDPVADASSAVRPPRKPLRLLVVLPSWLGDAVMATPALRLLRTNLPGSFIGGLMRPGLDELLAGSDLLDEMHVDRARGVMGPKLAANKLRPRRYDTALLLTNSFSTALITRLAFIPRRIGYDRDARGLLLTDKLRPDRTGPLAGLGIGGFTCVSAVDYYLRAAEAVFEGGELVRTAPRLELATTSAQDQAAADILKQARIAAGDRYAILNPGANNPAKRWPADRFAAVAAHLVGKHGMRVLVNGGPAEHALADEVIAGAARLGAPEEKLANLPKLGITIGALKALVRGAAVMLTNDTGPRHIAAARGTPVVTLFGPTDPRWTTLPAGGSPSIEIVSDPTLPAELLADDHPERCRIEQIQTGEVLARVDEVLAAGTLGAENRP
jgi:heptosyltransferase II